MSKSDPLDSLAFIMIKISRKSTQILHHTVWVDGEVTETVLSCLVMFFSITISRVCHPLTDSGLYLRRHVVETNEPYTTFWSKLNQDGTRDGLMEPVLLSVGWPW